MLRALILLLMTAAIAVAQSAGSATLVGTVADSSGAAIPGAHVTVRNEERAFVYEGETTVQGDYYIPYLPSGTYQLEIAADGFKTFVQKGIVLRTNEQPRINVALEIGSIAESITVEGAPPLLNTETAVSGQVLDGSTVQKIPVMQKFVHRVLLYMPGVSNINGQHAVGQRNRAMGYTLDGINAKEPSVGQVGDYTRTQIVSLNSVQEFKMYTTGMPAEHGHSGGGQFNAVFRSGSNEFHGDFDMRYTNGKMIHRHFFERDRRNGPFDYYEWGGGGGGPIVKNKTFFFGGFQQHNEQLSENFRGDVPSLEMLKGNFDFGAGTFPIYDPRSTVQDANGNWTRTQFANNQIPQTQFDPVARNLLGLSPWKDPTGTGSLTPSGPQQNLDIEADGAYKFERFDVKIDHQFSSNHKIFGRWSLVHERSPGRPAREIRELQFQPTFVTPRFNRNIVVSDNYTFSPTMINEFTFGTNRYHYRRSPQTLDQDWAGQLGIPGVSAENFPEFRNSSGGRYYNLGQGGREESIGEDYTIKENVTKILGRHTLKMGYEFGHTRYTSTPQATPTGQYNMSGTEFPFKPNTGNQFANLLLGGVGQGIFTMNTATWQPRFWYHGAFMQDSWKVRDHLSLELGLRWNYESPFQAANQSQFDPNVVDAVSGRMGAITHPTGNLAKSDWNNFQPRLGLSWNFADKWVFRSSYGLITIDLLTNGINQNFEEFFATAAVQAPPGDPRPAFYLSDGPGAINFVTNPDGSVPFSGSNYSGRTASWYDPNMRMPYIMNWSGGFQYQMTKTWLLEAQYQGSAGVGLLNNWDINQIPLNISNDPTELNAIFRATQNYKPWNQFGSIQHYSNYGHNTYHGGTLRMEKRYSAGTTFSGFYTFSKAIDGDDDDGAATGVTFYNRRLEKARAGYDIRHRFVGVLTTELPFGKGRKWLSGGGPVNAVLGGWNFAMTQTIQSGPPVSFSFAGSPYNYLPGVRRPNQVLPNDDILVHNWDIGTERFIRADQNRYFTAVTGSDGKLTFPGFEYPAAFQPGTVGRNTVQAPSMFWMQLSLSKQFKFADRYTLELRWDLNNATKQAQFANPDTTFNSVNTANFGTFNGTRGSFSDVGTARMHHIAVLRFIW
ncbi:MAG: hypothetical protein GC160_26325 [Acidobacteria bacterium]|nr:hypothetical protein [Acidobacteriota bacterium]